MNKLIVFKKDVDTAEILDAEYANDSTRRQMNMHCIARWPGRPPLGKAPSRAPRPAGFAGALL
ncbi:3-isopropylmalate dehydratase small subunit [Variovorax soli]|uniref:3-isopropylmalate dehydratase small subunit n=1 Tax=Variovorax soli TaxID=376815 RepID=A0ABU1ND95_9BURK|nr:3-isopropylmalate dehydratase small subunit [Variovorax soli]